MSLPPSRSRTTALLTVALALTATMGMALPPEMSDPLPRRPPPPPPDPPEPLRHPAPSPSPTATPSDPLAGLVDRSSPTVKGDATLWLPSFPSREERRNRKRLERARGRFAGPFVFLDFDGVLNHTAWFSARKVDRGPDDWRWDAKSFDKACDARLNVLLRRTRARVVVSSSWRTMRVSNLTKGWPKKREGVQPPEEMGALLRQYGFEGEVIGCTPELQGPASGTSSLVIAGSRAREIKAWLDAHAEPDAKFVILDDEDFADVDGRLILTNFFDGGLQDHHVNQAVAMLRGTS